MDNSIHVYTYMYKKVSRQGYACVRVCVRVCDVRVCDVCACMCVCVMLARLARVSRDIAQ